MNARQPLPHEDVGNVRLEEFAADYLEPHPLVERNRMGLGVQPDRIHATALRRAERGVQDRRSDAAATPRCEDRHAADLAIRQQPRGADRLTVFTLREEVRCALVEPVPLQLFRDALFPDEHDRAHCGQGIMRLAPANDPNRVERLQGGDERAPRVRL